MRRNKRNANVNTKKVQEKGNIFNGFNKLILKTFKFEDEDY